MANPEHLEILKQGAKIWKKWHEENPIVLPDLSDANLSGAYLSGANLGDANTNLIGDRPYFSIGPVGSRSDNLTLWITEKGPLLKTGCFGPDTFEAFRSNLEREHPVGSTHRKEYEAAILMCEAHAALWTPKSVEA